MSETQAEYRAGEQQQLKPCPWCGDNKQSVLWSDMYGAYVECNGCKAVGPDARSYEEAVEVWNTRAADAEVERLRAQVAQAKAAIEVLAVEAYYNDHRDDWRNPDCGLRLEHEATGKDAPAPWQFAADALKELDA